MSFDEEPDNVHGECEQEILRLREQRDLWKAEWEQISETARVLREQVVALEDHIQRVACWDEPKDIYLEIRRWRDEIYERDEKRRHGS
jgi:hypothetical protein